ncbi:hypothetical protein CAI21_19765 [Alkalilimnicola ehrlichii]|uniref:Nitrate/nitrite sensing protein domain-containing protein n=1 Tax=Alkalilimnicola ehrlichii TaxID=351052 RepID=A0A3E0WK02_9GAMM|nr:nitrate- and nitrite sensing domain-containing protein [Alkalilimnicola ehrlichii]RFA25209.1 hypothetical protein CAI21_19765 [Alkalilimnicola ehrlichii]RFA32286.1 hypothetical protein CAL65_20180 [Alkalilimnicola ehrlichii]
MPTTGVFSFVLATAAVVYLSVRRRRQRRLSRFVCGFALQEVSLQYQLLRRLQQHRGMSVGILNGDESFEEPRARLQAEIDSLFKRQIGQALPAVFRDVGTIRERLPRGWQTLRQQWRGWDGDHCLQQHNALIAKQLNGLVILALESGLLAYDEPRHRHLADIIARRLPDALERTGQLRALATGCAATGCCTALHRVRLRFLSEQVRNNLSAVCKSTQAPFGDQELAEVASVTMKQVDRFLTALEGELIDSAKIALESAEVFAKATQALETQFSLAESVLQRLALIHAHDARVQGRPSLRVT